MLIGRAELGQKQTRNTYIGLCQSSGDADVPHVSVVGLPADICRFHRTGLGTGLTVPLDAARPTASPAPRGEAIVTAVSLGLVVQDDAAWASLERDVMLTPKASPPALGSPSCWPELPCSSTEDEAGAGAEPGGALAMGREGVRSHRRRLPEPSPTRYAIPLKKTFYFNLFWSSPC